MDIVTQLRKKAQQTCPTLVFPEGNEAKIVEAATRLAKDKVIKAIVLGNRAEIETFGIDTSGLTILDCKQDSEKITEWAQQLTQALDMPVRMLTRQLKNPLNYGAAMVNFHEADGMVAGLTYSTSDVLLSATMYIGLEPDVRTASSFFLMDIQGWSGGENGLIMYADGGVVPQPDADELAGIALSTADSATRLLGWEPRVALLSFSTKGSAKHADVSKVKNALEIAKERRPDLLIDGELQADAAIDPEVAAKKAGADNLLQGRANILIFPDLDAGNIAYKLTQRLAGGKAYGPILQGFAKPVSDLSRGSSVEDILGVAIITAAQVQTKRPTDL